MADSVGVFVVGYEFYQAIPLDENAGDQSDSVKFGYKLIGPRGKTYHLMRMQNRPEIMIAMDLENRLKAPEFNRRLFTDSGSEGLRIAN